MRENIYIFCIYNYDAEKLKLFSRHHCYIIYLQSSLGNGAGGTVGETFFYDWSQMEDCKYKVSFSFISAVATLTNTAVGTK